MFAPHRASRRCFLRLLCLLALAVWALGLVVTRNLSRRSFVFYTPQGDERVEERMLDRSGSLEANIRRYVEEALLGPVTLELSPLFPRGTRLESALYREGTLYLDFSASALVSAPGGPDPLPAFMTLKDGIERNFPPVRELHFFIRGEEIFPLYFSKLFF